MYMNKSDSNVELAEPASYRVALVVSSVLILLIGIFPDQILRLVVSP
jgi:hypothetical protein